LIRKKKEEVSATIDLRREGYRYKGANPNGLALSPDQKDVVRHAGEAKNAIAVWVNLQEGKALGRIPDGVVSELG